LLYVTIIIGGSVKKNIKKLLVVLLIIVICIFFISIMFLNKKNTNNETSLICERSSNYIDFIHKEKVIINFDEYSIINDYRYVNEIIYNTNEEALDYYNEVKEYNDKIELHDNIVVIFNEFNSENIKNYKNMNKEEIMLLYEEELMYECK